MSRALFVQMLALLLASGCVSNADLAKRVRGGDVKAAFELVYEQEARWRGQLESHAAAYGAVVRKGPLKIRGSQSPLAGKLGGRPVFLIPYSFVLERGSGMRWRWACLAFLFDNDGRVEALRALVAPEREGVTDLPFRLEGDRLLLGPEGTAYYRAGDALIPETP